MVFGFITDFLEDRKYVSMVDSKSKLTYRVYADERAKPQALDVILAEVDENDFLYEFSLHSKGEKVEKKPCLLYLNREGHFNIVSPAIQEVSFQEDIIKIQLGKNNASDEVLIRSADSELISKLKQYQKN